MFANWIRNNLLDNWKGWKCYAGVTRISVDKTCNVYSGDCHNDFLGNALDDSLNLLTEPTTCKQDRCTGCTADLMIKKYQPQI